MATHSSTLAWKIPWMEEPGRLQSMRSQRVGHNWATSLSLSCIGEGNGNPLQCSCLENPRGGGAWWAAVCGVAQRRTRLKWLSSSSSIICWVTDRKCGFLVSIFFLSILSSRILPLGFLGGPVVENPRANAGTQDKDSIPDLERSHVLRANWIHAPQLLGPCSKACEPRLLEPECLGPALPNKRSHCNEKLVHHSYGVAPILKLEKGQVQQRRPSTPKSK